MLRHALLSLWLCLPAGQTGGNPMEEAALASIERVVPEPSVADLLQAAAAVRSYLDPTPLVATTADNGALLKLECWQPTGSFKVRGAIAALAALPEHARRAGVVAASAGNHGLGIAYAAMRSGIAATVVVPATASPAKVDALRRFGANLVRHGDDYDAAEVYALDLAARGATYVSAYNDTHVIAGQASIGYELNEQIDEPLTVVTPVGGGGLAAGLTLWAAGHSNVRVVGVEAEASRAVSAAAAVGQTVTVPVGATLADGLAGNIEPGSITPVVLASHDTAMIAVSEAEIRHAMRFLAGQHGLVVEGSGAVAVAALLLRKIEVVGRAVALVTGRNIALPTFADAVGGDLA
ncbi:pyridoxal-phosphate dependent enzyme [Micromonospora sp. WMMA1363]|uniref:threonine ammonia-lyase n=1 Tax=Micromonospora sp. WMMA1363 TaxID=3053985 RepID=UPI00259CD5E4|nr:pyridoxal-phosphate dependent enzyme [Micromonospora sp. WMMA1363]MDM4719686.1 pyridoxal-phosphate dependent enzyme [Micromonospora sp. WMMA1363]